MLRGTALAVAAMTAVVALAVPAGARTVPTGPRGDAFYVPPSSLPPAPPGTPIRAQPIAAPSGARAWRILYHSTGVGGSDVAVSGLLVAPDGSPPKGGRPVVTWAHGTTGLADLCAPSRAQHPLSGIPALSALLKAGDVVAATDYEGLGTPGAHPYLVGSSEGRSVLDAARAARLVPGTGAGRDVVALGHSQGGHAVLFAGELAATYAPDLHLLGVVVAAPVADLTALLPAAITSPTALGLVVMGIYGAHAADAQADPASVLTSGAIAKAGVLDRACALPILAAYEGAPAAVIARDPGTVPPWPALFAASSAGARPIPAPLLVVQGGADTLIDPFFTQAFVAKECKVGTRVDYVLFPNAGHGTVIAAARATFLRFLAARVRGAPVPDACPGG